MYAVQKKRQRWAHYRCVFSRNRAQQIIDIIDKVKPDIIHAHGLAWQMGYGWIPLARKRGYPCIYTAHGVMHVSYGKVVGDEAHLWWQDLKHARWSYNPLRNGLIRSALNQCQAHLCVSDALQKYLRQYHFENLQILHNGIDVRSWKTDTSKQDARRALHLPSDKVIFLLAGRIGHDKGSTAIIEALPRDAHLIVAGSFDPTTFRQLGERTHLFPHQTAKQMCTLYAACDAALVLSVYLDPFPTICLEAMACQRPVIATIYGGSHEAVVDNLTGWMVDPLRIPDLQHRLEWCMSHPEELIVAGENGQRHVEEKFSLEKYAQSLLAFYNHCLQMRH